MIKPINKSSSLNFPETDHAELMNRLMAELEERNEFVCYGTDCPSGYCTGGYTK